MEEKKNIWSSFDFTEKNIESAYDIINQQANELVEATSGELTMEVTATDAFVKDTMSVYALYMLYVVAPKLGNFRKKILTIIEKDISQRFPVDIVSHITDEKKENIEQENFIKTIQDIFSETLVKRAIENLYKQSKSIK